MRRAMTEMDRRRAKQGVYNEAHGITPTTVVRAVRDTVGEVYAERDYVELAAAGDALDEDGRSLKERRADLEQQMYAAAKDLRFEDAGKLRDALRRVEKQLLKTGGENAPPE